MASFEIHLENFNHALHISNNGHHSDLLWLLGTLEKHGVKPKIFVLEDWIGENCQLYCDLIKDGHKLLSHGVHHYYDEKADRSPYFNQEGIPFPPSGGFFFRIMPLCYLVWATKKSGIFWIHPHDLDESHPKLKNPIMNWKRHVGLKGAKKKLEALLASVDNWD